MPRRFNIIPDRRSRRLLGIETIHTPDVESLLKASDLRFEYYDKERLPATSWVQVQRLVDPGYLVEIEVVAELP